MQQNLPSFHPDEKKVGSIAYHTSRLLQVILCVCCFVRVRSYAHQTTHSQQSSSLKFPLHIASCRLRIGVSVMKL